MLTSLRKIWLLGSVLCLGLMVFACGSTPDDTDGADAAKLDGFDGMGGDDPADGGDPNLDGGDLDMDGGDMEMDGGDNQVDGGDVHVDGGDIEVDGGDVEPDGGDVEPDGGDVQVDGGDVELDGGGDVDLELAHASLFLAGSFNDWDAAAVGFEFGPVAAHTWLLTAHFEEGLHTFKLTADGSWALNFGSSGGQVAHFESDLQMIVAGQDLPFICLYAGTYELTYHDQDRTLSVRLPDRPADSSPAFDADPRSVDNRGLGGILIDQALVDAPELGDSLASLQWHGGTPLRGGDKLHFLTLAPDAGQPIYLAGSLNGWDGAADAMIPLAGTRLNYLAIDVPNTHLAYKFVFDGNWFDDAWNPNVEWDQIEFPGVGSFNTTLPLMGIQRTAGRLVRLADYHSTIMGDERDIFLYLPNAYDREPGRQFGLMVVHDGNESITRSQFDLVTDAEIAAGRVAPIVMAFVALPSQNIRIDEYTFHTGSSRGELYSDFICDELVPLLDQELRLDPDTAQRALMGASLGGLISYFIGWERYDTFGLVAGMSSTFFWDDNYVVGQVQNDSGPLRPLRFYLDSADVNDNHDETVLMQQALEARGYPHMHIIQAGASHDWYFWNHRFPGMLQYLFAP